MKDEFSFGAGFVLGAFAVILIAIFRKSGPATADPHVIQADFPDGQKIFPIGANFKMELREGQKVRVTAKPKTRRGNPAAIEPGSGSWTSTDDSVVSCTPVEGDELSADLEGVDGSENETVAVEFRADGKRGEGERPIVIAGAVTCTQGDAVTGDLEFGDVVDPEAESAGGGSEGGGPAEGGLSSGAGGTANQGVDANPSAGSGEGSGASGTTAPSESDQPADQGGEVPTVQEAGQDTIDRNPDTLGRQSDTA